MKGGHTDNYYYQMIDGIRRFKGVAPAADAGPGGMITIDGSFADWADVEPEFRDTVYDTTHRNEPGWGTRRHLRQHHRPERLHHPRRWPTMPTTSTSMRKPATRSRPARTRTGCCCSSIRTAITPPAGRAMTYLVNLTVIDSTTTTLRQSTGGWNWTQTATLSYAVAGNKMEIKIPRSAIGLAASTSDRVRLPLGGQHPAARRHHRVRGQRRQRPQSPVQLPLRQWPVLVPSSIRTATSRGGCFSTAWAAGWSRAARWAATSPERIPTWSRAPSSSILRSTATCTCRMKNGTSGNSASFYWVTQCRPHLEREQVRSFPDRSERYHLPRLLGRPELRTRTGPARSRGSGWIRSPMRVPVTPTSTRSPSAASFMGDFDADGVPTAMTIARRCPTRLRPMATGTASAMSATIARTRSLVSRWGGDGCSAGRAGRLRPRRRRGPGGLRAVPGVPIRYGSAIHRWLRGCGP